MKKFNSRFIRAVLVTALLGLANAMPTFGQTWKSENFIGSGGSGMGATVAGFNGYLQINSGQTLQFGTNNLVYSRGTIITNILTTITNVPGTLVITGYVSQVFPVWTTNASGISDCTLWGNRDGTAPLASISVDINGNGFWSTNGTGNNQGFSQFTNALTFNFETEGDGPGQVVGAGGPAMGGTFVGGAYPQNLWSFTISGNGTNDVYVTTNLPQTFLQGSRALRLQSIVSTSAGTATNGQIVGVWLNGYIPASSQ